MLSAPFMKRVWIERGAMQPEEFPFNALPYLKGEFELNFSSSVTILVGENGSGKSTLIEAMAQACGFSAQGGEQGYLTGKAETRNALTKALRFSWLPKVSKGFFFRAESFFNYQTYIDKAYSDALEPSPGMHLRSHGEAFLEAFTDRLRGDRRSMFFLDEPEVALSPQRQLVFLRIMREWQLSGQVQAIIATHSPILMSLPDATLLSLDGGTIRPIALEDTEHYRITTSFLGNPTAFLADLFRDLG